MFYKDRTNKLEKIIKKNYYKNLPDTVNKKNTEIEVKKGWLPFTDSYFINITPKDKYGIEIAGEYHSDEGADNDITNTFYATIKRKKRKIYCRTSEYIRKTSISKKRNRTSFG